MSSTPDNLTPSEDLALKKKCFTCELIKPLTDFHNYPTSLDGKMRYCKACWEKMQQGKYIEIKEELIQRRNFESVTKELKQRYCVRRDYQNNKDKYKQRDKTQYTIRKDFINAFKNKCVICGETRKHALVFHHKDPKEKICEISAFSKGISKQVIIDEIKKCTVLCSNCHKELHHFMWHKESMPIELLARYNELGLILNEESITDEDISEEDAEFIKKCSLCQRTRILDNFYDCSTSPDGKMRYCKECYDYMSGGQNELLKTMIQQRKRKEYMKNYRQNRNKSICNLINFYKTECVICGEKRKHVLEFHHKDPKTKTCNINIAKTTFSREKLIAEIKKCDILCSNCHHLLHYFQRNPEEKPTELFERQKGLSI